MKYAAFVGIAPNIGDEIQNIAAQRFLPRVDHYIVKELMNRFHSEEKTKLIMNAWLISNPKSFPPQDCVDPLLLSMHFNIKCRKAVLSKKGKAFFLKHGPVGCRDMSTKKWLEENNIPAYFSGCLTSTLVANENLRAKYPEKYILCVDCDKQTMDYVRQKAAYPVYCISKHVSPIIDMMDRLEVAKAFLFLYQNAHCVVTRNLHTAVPCLGFNTRVCLIELELPPGHFAMGRFDGMEGYFNQVTKESFLAGAYDFNNPPENPKAFEETRDAMIRKCREFTGFDSNKPTLDDDFDPTNVLISLIAKKRTKKDLAIQKELESAGGRELMNMLMLKMKGKGQTQAFQSKHDKASATDIGEEIISIASQRFSPEGDNERKLRENRGSLTATLVPNESLRKKYPDRHILCVDCEERYVNYVKQKADCPVVSVSSLIPAIVESTDRMKIAKAFLFMYQNARCVVTANLQAAVSCMALNTRVCLIESASLSPASSAADRFDGPEGCFNLVKEQEFFAGAYDFNNPPDNPKAFEEARAAMIGKCREVTGCDAGTSTLHDDFNPTYMLISSISKLRYRDNYKFASGGDLVKALMLLSIKKADNEFYAATGFSAFKNRIS